MGIHITSSTMPGGVTPICNECGVALCWDISLDEYNTRPLFWDEWLCDECRNTVEVKYEDEHEACN